MNRRVVVTGLGLVTPVGNSVETTWTALMEGRSGADFIKKFDAARFAARFACEVKHFDPLDYVEKKEARKMGAFIQYAIAASQEAVKAALAILRELYAHSPESVLIKAHLIEAYIRAGSESEAESVLQTIPAEDKAVQLEIFRAWSLHHANGNSAGEEHWKAIFLFFGLLHAGDQLVCGHLFQSSP